MAPRLHLCVLSALVFLSGIREPLSPHGINIRISDYLFVLGNQFYFMDSTGGSDYPVCWIIVELTGQPAGLQCDIWA